MPKYSKTKKQEALVMLETKSIEEVSAEMHIHAHTLQRWLAGTEASAKGAPAQATPRKARKESGEAKADVLTLAKQMLVEGNEAHKLRLQELEEENARLRIEAAALRQKCDEYHAVVAALVAMIH